MSTAPKNSKWRKGLLWVIFLIMLGIFLQHIPGTYTIDDFQDDYELTSPEGIALLALSDASLSAELYFKTAKRHRISRRIRCRVHGRSLLWLAR